MRSYVLVVRDPDFANEFTVDGDVRVIDIDLGSSFTHHPEGEEQAVEWARGRLRDLNGVPTDSPVYQRAIETISAAVEQYGKASKLVERYQARRGRT